MMEPAVSGFTKADKQDGGQCLACSEIVKYALEFEDWMSAPAGAEGMIARAQENKDEAVAHFLLGLVLLEEGIERRKD